MAKDLKLTQAQDLELENGDLAFIEDGEEVIQAAKIGLLHILGEWVFDYTLGVDWFGIMWSTTTSIAEKRKEIQRVLVNTEGVRRLLRLEFSIDPIERAAFVEFAADTNFGPISTELTI
ncbi:hypothetical protein GWN42_13555 [candidate division KSB1 bacterium]|nr:hypothetical protein [candidate division KSB1 bacterium]